MSTLDKLGWAKAPRVLIVWPRYGRVLTRRLDLVLIQRNAQQRSKQIGLVTHDPDIRAYARELGIPVFDSLDDISEKKWHRRVRSRPITIGRESPPPPDYLSPPDETVRATRLSPADKILRYVLTGVALIGLLLLVATLVPKAEITITPQSTVHEQKLTLLLDPEIEQPLPNRIPARWEAIVVEGTLRKPTSGSATVPDQTSIGSVIFTNLTTDSVSIPEGTGLRASAHGDLRFVTTEDVNLAPGRNSEAVAEIQAVVPGLASNLPIGAIDSVEGPLGLVVSVTNPESTSGGTDETRPAVSPDDRINLIDELSSQLYIEATEKILATLDSDLRLVEESLRLRTTIDQSFDREVGEPADSLSLNLVMEIEGLVYHPDDIDSTVRTALEAALSEETLLVPDTLSFVILSGPVMAGTETASISILAEQETYRVIDFSRIRELIRGHTKEYTADLLERLINLESRPEIQISPAWFPRLPWLGFRIEIGYDWEAG
ncbi:MAG: baseplate J/gp47 family protein [Anaerolineaceae bacterium]|nr:MAG: baseplate J/gp47 family protein [Anaerolineaceae bacterium]